MKQRIIGNVILTLLLCLSFYGCEKHEGINEPVHGSGRIVSETRTVSECKGLDLTYAGSVYLTKDDNQSIRIEADDNIIRDVVTTADNGIFKTGLRGSNYTDVTVRIYVSLKTIESITLNGAGIITMQNDLSGSALDCGIIGAGDITLQGNVTSLNCFVNGAGNINAYNLTAVDCLAKVLGTGNCFVKVTSNLDASIAGVGNITYDGNPTLKSSVTGIGRISKK